MNSITWVFNSKDSDPPEYQVSIESDLILDVAFNPFLASGDYYLQLIFTINYFSKDILI